MGGPPRISMVLADGTRVLVPAKFSLDADLSRLRTGDDDCGSPARIRMLCDDGTEVEVPVQFGLTANLSRLRPLRDKRKHNTRLPVVDDQV